MYYSEKNYTLKIQFHLKNMIQRTRIFLLAATQPLHVYSEQYKATGIQQ